MAKKTLMLSSVLAAAGCGLASIQALLGQGFWPQSRLGEIIGFHLGALIFSGATLALCFPAFVRKTPFTFLALVFGFCAPLPLVGLFFLIFLLLLFRLYPGTTAGGEYYFGERQVMTPMKSAPATSEMPHSIMEILSGEDKDARRRAIVALRAVDPKQSLPVLQKAIQDSDEHVRLLAQTQFNRIIAGLELAVKSLETELSSGPAKRDRLVQLAEEYHELVYLGLSSDETQIIYLERAIELLRAALRLAPDDHAAQMLLLKCYLRSHKLAEARECLARLRQNQFNPEILEPWDAEIHFQERNWRSLTQCLEGMRGKKGIDCRLARQVDFWLGPETSEEWS